MRSWAGNRPSYLATLSNQSPIIITQQQKKKIYDLLKIYLRAGFNLVSRMLERLVFRETERRLQEDRLELDGRTELQRQEHNSENHV